MERRGACQRSRQRTFFRKLFDIKGLSVYPSLCELVEGIVTGPRTPSHSDARTYYHAASSWISCVAGPANRWMCRFPRVDAAEAQV
jgi:hypothetical protein